MALIGPDLFKALALGFIAGLTQLLPVSTAAHLLFAQRFGGLDAQSVGAAFLPVVELAALAALVSVYALRVWRTLGGAVGDPAARRFLLGILVAFLPSAVFGGLAHDFVRTPLSDIYAVAFVLIVGGAVLAWADRRRQAPRYHDVTEFPPAMCLWIGLAQCAALIPGASRVGVTIVAALLLGADRRSAADFSLWLAMPSLAATLGYDLYRNPAAPGFSGLAAAAIGFVAAFLAAWCVARTFLDFASRRGFTPFAWWRVMLGSLGLIALALGL